MIFPGGESGEGEGVDRKFRESCVCCILGKNNFYNNFYLRVVPGWWDEKIKFNRFDFDFRFFHDGKST